MYLYVTICVWFGFESKCLIEVFFAYYSDVWSVVLTLFENSISSCLPLITVKMYFGQMTFLFL